MAVVPISFVVEEHGVMREEAHPVPADDVQVLLYILTDLPFPSDTNPFSTSELVRFGLSILQNRDQLHQVLEPSFVRVGIDTSSITYYDIVQEIVEFVLEASWTGVDARETLCLSCIIRADINGDNSLTRSLTESASEFERDSYGMVAATEASIEEMLERVEVEAGDETCLICLNQLEVGFEASRMPCSHGFHCDCIQKWLRQSHYCPICRFEMPTV
ncbi:hypothetical protein V6N13_068794 [Hibiscus sabdariffa]|uniref:Uncharacterized protein n=2 Tax=Hibiscus sabdariffa TaxID=183260 RepID=A0ABR2QNP7_9ROSI